MTGRQDGFDEIFDANILVRESCKAKNFIGDGSQLTNLPIGAETDPVFTAWDKDYDDLTNKPTIPSITGLVPYTGATGDVDLGTKNINAAIVTFGDTFKFSWKQNPIYSTRAQLDLGGGYTFDLIKDPANGILFNSAPGKDLSFEPSTRTIKFTDGTRARVFNIGSTKYLELKHDGTNSVLSSSSGDIVLNNNVSARSNLKADGYLSSDGSAGITVTDTVVTDVRDNAGQLQKKTKTLVFKNGIRTDTGAESDWTDTTDI